MCMCVLYVTYAIPAGNRSCFIDNPDDLTVTIDFFNGSRRHHSHSSSLKYGVNGKHQSYWIVVIYNTQLKFFYIVTTRQSAAFRTAEPLSRTRHCHCSTHGLRLSLRALIVALWDGQLTFDQCLNRGPTPANRLRIPLSIVRSQQRLPRRLRSRKELRDWWFLGGLFADISTRQDQWQRKRITSGDTYLCMTLAWCKYHYSQTADHEIPWSSFQVVYEAGINRYVCTYSHLDSWCQRNQVPREQLPFQGAQHS